MQQKFQQAAAVYRLGKAPLEEEASNAAVLSDALKWSASPI